MPAGGAAHTTRKHRVHSGHQHAVPFVDKHVQSRQRPVDEPDMLTLERDVIPRLAIQRLASLPMQPPALAMPPAANRPRLPAPTRPACGAPSCRHPGRSRTSSDTP